MSDNASSAKPEDRKYTIKRPCLMLSYVRGRGYIIAASLFKCIKFEFCQTSYESFSRCLKMRNEEDIRRGTGIKL